MPNAPAPLGLAPGSVRLAAADPALRDAYAALKCDLAARFLHDRGAYTEGKAAFVRRAVATALAHAPAHATTDVSGER